MALTLAQLQDYVNANILQNGRNAITGNVMNYALMNTLDLLDGKQDALASGITIKTINGDSILGSGNLTVSASLIVGSTAITSGTDTRVLFQSGGVIQQSAMLTFNDTGVAGSTTANFANTFNRTGNNFRIYGNNGATTLISSEGGGSGLYATSTYEIVSTSGNNFNFRIGTGSPISAMYINSSLNIGIGTISPVARLDVKAQGALSSDLIFRVKNSANTQDLYKLQGDGGWMQKNNAGNAYFYYDGASTYEFATPSQLFLQTNTSTPSFSIQHNGNSAGTYLALRTQSQSIFIYRNGNFYFGASPQAGTGTNSIIIENATAPTSNISTAGQLYVESGALKYRGAAGTVTTIANS